MDWGEFERNLGVNQKPRVFLRIDPTNAEILRSWGETMNRLALPDQASTLLDRAYEIESYVPPNWIFSRGHAENLLGNPDKALSHLLPIIAAVPGFMPAKVPAVRALSEIGQSDAAKNMVKSIGDYAPRFSLTNVKRMFPYPHLDHRDALIWAFKNAGFPK